MLDCEVGTIYTQVRLLLNNALVLYPFGPLPLERPEKLIAIRSGNPGFH